MTPPVLEKLRMPKILNNLCELRQGLVIVVGPTGHGKSTTIAAMIDRINESRSEHIICIEDPIEFVFANKQSLIDQREMFLDTHSWDIALKSVLRQDPNIVMIGEMRDSATLHTNSAAQSVERIISSFPEERRSEVRQQFSQVLEVIISQRLLVGKNEGLVPAVELLFATDAVKNLIREGKTHLIDNIISNSINIGMTSLDRSLASLVVDEQIELEEALKVSMRPDEMRRLIKEYKFNQPKK
jgi:twitching motility protein PilT